MTFQVRCYNSSDEDDVVSLWEVTFPNEPARNSPRALIQQKLTTQPDLFFVCLDGTRLIGTTMAGYDGVRGWVHKVASHPDYRGKGVAKQLMQHTEEALRRRGCTKLNLQVHSSNTDAVDFYRSLGYLDEARVSLGKQLTDD